MKCRIEHHTITSKVGVLSTKRFELLAQTGVVLAGLRCAIAGRNLAVGSDGLAYLDVARAYLRHDWSLAVNGYWGPLYPWLLAVALRILHPSDAYEFATVQAVNFLIFLLCLYAFHKFWYSVADWNRQHKGDGTSLPDAYPLGWLFLGYTLFLLKVTWFVNAVAPDVLVASVVLLIATQVLEIDRCKRVTDYVVLGLLLALGFYAKAILFYFGFFTLLAVTIRDFRFVLWGITFSCVFVPVTSESLARRALLAGILVFAAYSLPGIVHYLFLPAENQIERDLLIAKAIAEHGIRAGDAVALIGDGQTAYWAHWARASVAAEISSLDSPVFWSASFESQWSAVRSMRALGAKAVIWRRDSDRPCPQGWTELPQNSGCIIALNPPDLARTSEAAANHR